MIKNKKVIRNKLKIIKKIIIKKIIIKKIII
jgi:hypothetical protein